MPAAFLTLAVLIVVLLSDISSLHYEGVSGPFRVLAWGIKMYLCRPCVHG